MMPISRRIALGLVMMVVMTLSVVHAVPASLCGFGYGDGCEQGAPSCPTANFPPARPGDCAPCEMEGCVYCSYAKGECGSCKAGYYPVLRKIPCEEVYGSGATGTCTAIQSCRRCSGSCGFCTGKDDSKCQDKALECAPHKAKAAVQATRVEWRGNACMNRMGMHGDGYTRYYYTWVQNGTCMDCKIGIQEISTSLGKTMLCRVLARALDVAANAWKGVDCEDDPTYTLQDWCFGNMSNAPFGMRSVNLVFSSQCRTARKGVLEKIISSNGGLDVLVGPSTASADLNVKLIDFKKWTWAEAPVADASGRCTFSQEYNLSPVSCPRFQLVSYKNCKLSTATLTNGEYFVNSFDKYIPKWKISGDSSSAVLRSVRSCPNSTLTTNLSKAAKIHLATSSSNKDTSYMIKPIGKVCNIVQLMRNAGGQDQFLTVSSDCVKVSWSSEASERSQFKLERACNDRDQSAADNYGCTFDLYPVAD